MIFASSGTSKMTHPVARSPDCGIRERSRDSPTVGDLGWPKYPFPVESMTLAPLYPLAWQAPVPVPTIVKSAATRLFPGEP
ncbi:hypothetical protein ACFV27_06485 [Streptomyces antimycoticus]|uniref:hypothetical protein n=1 Tax=Streptomyces antimycoticus TaxID=68175 RepID=UPI0036C1C8A7